MSREPSESRESAMPSATGTDPVTARVARAAEAKRRAEQEYRAALAAAKDAGISYAAIAHASGVSRQAVRQLLIAHHKIV